MKRLGSQISVLALVVGLSGCTRAEMKCFYGVAGEDVISSHQDGGTVGTVGPMTLRGTNTGGLQPNGVAEVRAEKEWDGQYSISALAGVRLINPTRFKFPYFYEVTGGLTHYPGENLFTLHPSFGVLFPKQGREWNWFVRVGLPIYFFSGNREIGTEFAVGIELPSKRK